MHTTLIQLVLVMQLSHFQIFENSKAIILGDMFELKINSSLMNIKKLLNYYQLKILIVAILLEGKIFKVKSTNESFYFYKTKEEFYNKMMKFQENHIF